MTGLPDYIFDNIEEKVLNKNKIEEFIRYLDEFIAAGLPLDKEQAYSD